MGTVVRMRALNDPSSKLLRRTVAAVAVVFAATLLPNPMFTFTESAAAAPADDVTVEQLGAGQVEMTAGPAGDAAEFSAVAVTFDELPEGSVTVRTRNNGTWSQWRPLDVSTDDGPDDSAAEAGTSRLGTEPLWVDSADQVQVRADGTADPQVITVVESPHRQLVTAEPAAGASAPVAIRSRAQWGARPAKSTSYTGATEIVVVHHTATQNSYTPDQVPSVLRSVQAYHMDTLGWSDIAYNLIVDKYGNAWEGRGGGVDRTVYGAHARGFNTNSAGIVALGDFTQMTPPAAMLNTVGRLAGWKLALSNRPATGTVDITSGGSTSIPAGQRVTRNRIIGHLEVGATACPGAVQQQLPTVRSAAASYQSTITPVGHLDVIEASGTNVRLAGWATTAASSSPVNVRVTTRAGAATTAANLPRPDVVAVYPTFPTNIGFSVTRPIPPGVSEVCATIVPPAGWERPLGCYLVIGSDGLSPTGTITATASPGKVTFSGTTSDPHGTPTTAQVSVDGTTRTSAAVTDTAFNGTISGVAAGRRRICARVANIGAGVDATIACATVTVPEAAPVGRVVEVAGGTRAVRVTGWALDPSSTGPTNIAVSVNGKLHFAPANRRRDDIAAAYAAYGTNHGFDATVPADPGTNRVCVGAADTAGAAPTLLGCWDRTVVK